ncbi:MAG: recombination mediator RecR [Pseudomonadota bacterium]
MYDGPLDNLTKLIASLPGLGSRSAKRIALYLLTHKENTMIPLSAALQDCADSIQECERCGNLDTVQPCRICRNMKRDTGTICVIASVADLWAIERTNSYKGRYHVLGGVLSALDGIGPNDLTIDKLIQKIKDQDISEVIIALSATVDGQSTAHFITDQIMDLGRDVKVTKLAHGVPVGGELDYLDDGTIATALQSRG